MHFEFTAAAERALAAAQTWTSGQDRQRLGVTEVLLGLLAEPECRAALLLAPYGVDAAAVERRFVDLAPADPGNDMRQFSREWLAGLETAQRLLIDYPQPLHLATEHLLLGVVASSNPVSDWLAEQGLHADWLESEVHRLSGYEAGPLPLDLPETNVAEQNGADLAPSASDVGLHNAGVDSEDDLTLPAATQSEQFHALRIIDAAANRAGEGLRVIEDYLRFVLDDAHLTRLCKAIRHELTATLAEFPAESRHAARDTLADVGTQITLTAEQARAGTREVLAASFKRLEQSLRSLEEFSKVLSPAAATALEALRYRAYTLERAVDLTRVSNRLLATARLYVLVDGRASCDELARLTEGLVAAGVDVIQLRDKQLPDRELAARARALRAATAGSSTLFIINDRPDLAAIAGADGVHLGQDELTVKDARQILGPHGLIGVSTHSIEQARRAVLEGANYLGVGPTFPSTTKRFDAFPGLEFVRAVQAEIRLPAFAIGGITLENLPQVLDTGIRRVAVSGAISAAADPTTAAQEFIAALDRQADDVDALIR